MGILCLAAVKAEPQRQGDDIREFGALPLYGPWKFSIGDSPLDPATRAPLWADTNFDDSAWENLTLWPNKWTDYPGARDHAYIPGWTARGHAGYWGYAWYRIRVIVRLRPVSQFLAVAAPDRVEDAFQVFLNGTLIGQFGDFKGRTPTTYYSQPTRFIFTVPPSSRSYPTDYPLVFAIRVWMGPRTLSTSYEPGGLRSKFILSTEDEIELAYLRNRSDLIASQLPLIVCAVAFVLLAILAYSLTLFAHSDRLYLWMGSALALMAISSGLRAFDLGTQFVLSILEDKLILQCFLWPLVYLVWLVVWSMWSGRAKSIWTFAGSVLTLIHMIMNVRLVVYGPSPTFDGLSFLIRVMFIFLLLWTAFPAKRGLTLEDSLVLPAVVLLAIRAIATENLIEYRVHSWTIFDAQFSVAQLVDFPLAALLAILLLHRLRMSARRNRVIELDAKRAQVQSDFVAAVSHEFRSPLTTIRTITDLLIDDRIPGESKRRESFLYLGRETKRLHTLVEALLDFGQIESGTMHYRMISCDAFEIARIAVAEFGDQAEAAGFDIELDFTPNSALIRADEEALRRIIRNLLENAVKYSPEYKQIWVLGEIENQMVLLSVRDRGMGIDPTDQRAIFQRFVRGDAAKKAGIKGTGIGLAMAKQICDAMGGEIHLQSELGIGSTFTVVFPLAKE